MQSAPFFSLNVPGVQLNGQRNVSTILLVKALGGGWKE
jgi:outer membrane protein TolC